MYDLEEFKRLRRSGDEIVIFDQCCYGAPSRKPTQILYKGARFDQLEANCRHQKRRLVDAEGRIYFAAHPSVVQQPNKDGSYRTKELAAYPPLLNKQIARIISDSLEKPSPQQRH